jgi:hypothetical protein
MRLLFYIMSLTTITCCSSCSLVPSETHKIIGNILIDIPVPEIQVNRESGSACSGDDYVKTSPANRFKVGSQVVVKDSKGEILGLGNLQQGIYTPTTSQEAITRFRLDTLNAPARPLSCIMSFAIENVPVSSYYTIDIGDDKLSVSKAELERNGYKVDLSITKGT